MRPKGLKDLTTFNAKEVKNTAAEKREREEYYSAKGQYKSI